MKKDDIEKLFSSLEDFSKNPPDDLWKGIEEKLASSEKKKGFAFWWPVAASLLIGLGLLATFYLDKGHSLQNIPVQHENGVVNQSRGTQSEENEDSLVNKESKPEILKGVVSNKNKEEQQTVQKNSVVSANQNPILQSNQKAVSGISKTAATIKEDKSKSLISSKSEENLTDKTPIATKNIAETTVPDSKIKENPIAAKTEENALETIAQEQQKKEKTTSAEEKWSLQLFAGINSSQNVRNQKSLGNTIESQTGYNYGVKTNYKFNRRWAVRAGVKVSELGQQLANVSYVNSAKSLVNVSKIPFSPQPKEKHNIVNNPNYLFIPQQPNQPQNTLSATFYETANLSQRMQYLELPLEVSYAILNKGKARINLNTGGFVGTVISNEVLLNNNAIGKNSDVNEMVFGTVLSSTLQYELYKKTKVFVEPGVNYYSQPVQNQNFNQLQLNFNFGLNISF